MSTMAAASSRNHIWLARFGKDQFSRKISVVVQLSFLGFLCQRTHLHGQYLRPD
ncbi:CASP-like protein 4U1 [Panicum miliaceum]|uniref:CASP-like protein 4U1 n=1 Tax=Panicum miliaceum TaxID=4540 RepID=A0A3L6TWA0_PANMI|nr:CASP-like protein 4U1 [Panicum miliaceum]